MCRNIKTLFNFEPPATELEIRDASLQFVRKLSGFNVPSQANREAFDRVQVRAKHLVNVSRVDTRTDFLGESLESPLFLCPVSSLKAFHGEGEIAAARAARAERTPQGLSTLTTSKIEDVVAARGEPVWFQLYPSDDAAVMKAIVKRAEAAGWPRSRSVAPSSALRAGSSRRRSASMAMRS